MMWYTFKGKEIFVKPIDKSYCICIEDKNYTDEFIDTIYNEFPIKKGESIIIHKSGTGDIMRSFEQYARSLMGG